MTIEGAGSLLVFNESKVLWVWSADAAADAISELSTESGNIGLSHGLTFILLVYQIRNRVLMHALERRFPLQRVLYDFIQLSCKVLETDIRRAFKL